MHRDWAPLGADRFYNLVKNGFYDDVRFFRVLEGFMAQFGMNGDPGIQRHLGAERNFNDDPVKQSNKRGFVTFAKAASPNSRTTQVFINFVDNAGLDAQGFAPFGQVTHGHGGCRQAVRRVRPRQRARPGPDHGRRERLSARRTYPKLDYVKAATIEP